MLKDKIILRNLVAIAICLAGFSVGNVLAQDSTIDQGVVINGVKWATRNVDKPGTFAANPEDTGMFYQWNRRIAWSATDPIKNSDSGIDWDTTVPEGAIWKKSNDPSPIGWRVPTASEISTLFDDTKVNNEWVTINGVKGRKFTDKTTGKYIFLPAGYRDGTGKLGSSIYGYYWSCDRSDAPGGYDSSRYLYFDYSDSRPHIQNGYRRMWGMSIRSVLE